jgi:hypothetical protein
MRALSVAFGAALGAVMLAGCGSSPRSSGVAQPKEDPAKAMVRLVQQEFAGRLERSYAMLIREQRDAVAQKLYVKCKPGYPTNQARVLVLGVKDEEFNVPVLGKTQTKAIRYEMSVPDAGGKRIKTVSTGHLIAQDGTWHWTLSERSLSAFLAGGCP